MSAPQPDRRRRHVHYAKTWDDFLPMFETAPPTTSTPQAPREESGGHKNAGVEVSGLVVPLGLTYSGDLDGERLTSQLDAVLALMGDGQWRTLSEIRAAIGRGSEAGLSARLREIRNSRRGVVERRRRGDPKAGLWEYKLSQ